MRKVIDAFIFYNELAMLEYRLKTLYDYVDFFIIVESTHSFAGNQKPLYFNQYKNKFTPYFDKIIHIVVSDMPNNDNAWDNEHHQRRCIHRGIEILSLKDDDLIIISDVDEIPNVNMLKDIKESGLRWPHNLDMDMYYYNLTCKYLKVWALAKITPFSFYKIKNDPQYLRNQDFKGSLSLAGWHLSFFGDVNFIKNKIKNFSHQEFNKDEFLNDETINTNIMNCKDVFFRDDVHKFKKIEISENNFLPPKHEFLIHNF